MKFWQRLVLNLRLISGKAEVAGRSPVVDGLTIDESCPRALEASLAVVAEPIVELDFSIDMPTGSE